MKSSYLMFYFSKLSIFSMAICFVSLFARLFVPAEFLSEDLPYYIVMFYVVTAISFVVLYKKRKTNFVPTFMLTKIIKFLTYIFVLILVFLLDIETNIKFAVSYCIIFFLFLVFDTITISQLSRKEVEESKLLKNTNNDEVENN
jgi:FlaA1/EpsC-like NDP-sugar epimerase